MYRLSLPKHVGADRGVRWIATHHSGNRFHIVITLARQGRRECVMPRMMVPEKPRALTHLASHLPLEQGSEKSCGAKGIQTPDLLHAMHDGFV
jgi:hypothetical protein